MVTGYRDEGDHLIVDYAQQADGWTLFLFDDLWVEAIQYLEISATHGRQAYEQSIQDDRDMVNRLGVGLVPSYAEQLEDLKRLAITGFIGGDEHRRTLSQLIVEAVAKGPVACLIDRYTSETRDGALDPALETYEFIRAKGIPSYRCALYATASRTGPPLEIIDKTVVVRSEGAELGKWWKRLRGFISYNDFEKKTHEPPGERWHNASTLSDQPDSRFLGFLVSQARQDYYGVWKWIYALMKDKGTISSIERYAYLCGKSFLRHGDGELHYTDGIPLPALRGLMHGLPFFLEETGSLLVEESGGYVPADLDNVDDPNVGHGAVPFNVFAYVLRSWLIAIYQQTGGGSRLGWVRLVYGEQEVVLILKFTQPLGPAMSDPNRTLGTAALWQKLRGCFENERALDLSSDVVTMRFAHVASRSDRMHA